MHVRSVRMRRRFIGLLVVGALLPGNALPAAQVEAVSDRAASFRLAQAEGAATEAQLWDALQSGDHIVLLRHAIAPGTGDPEDFEVGDCATQRNLSDQGRDQARRIGDRSRAHGTSIAPVFSSQWCRCLETARLLGLGPVTQLPVLNSFFRNGERREPQTQALRQWIAKQDLSSVLVLVTHQVNITALTGVYPQSGELVILRRDRTGSLSVVGTLRTE